MKSALIQILSIIFVILFYINNIFASYQDCHLLDSSDGVMNGFGASYNLFSTQEETILSAGCDGNKVRLSIKNPEESYNVYTWNQAYYTKNGRSWESPITLSGQQTKSGKWLVGNVQADVTFTSEQIKQKNYFAAFICLWVDSSWKCGCADKKCKKNYWSLQAFKGKESQNQENLPTLLYPKTPHKYIKISNQVLFHTDANGNAVISDDLTNIQQGGEDCWFLGTLMAVATRSQETVKSVVTDNGDGTYTGRFYGLNDAKSWAKVYGKGNYIARVNGDLPSKRKKLAYAGIETIEGKNVSWAAIIEKAWSGVMYNDYKYTDSDTNDGNHDIGNALFALTGIVPTERKVKTLTFKQLQQDLDNGAVAIGTNGKSGKLEDDHALAVLKVDPSTQKVYIGDPLGPRPVISFDYFIKTNINQYYFVPLPKD